MCLYTLRVQKLFVTYRAAEAGRSSGRGRHSLPKGADQSLSRSQLQWHHGAAEGGHEGSSALRSQQML